MSRREVMNQCSQHNHKTIDRIRQTVSSLGYWYNKDQLLDNTKKSPSKPKKGQKSQKENLIAKKKGSKEQMKMMTREDKQVMKAME